jgi:hypothetical protein
MKLRILIETNKFNGTKIGMISNIALRETELILKILN